MKCLIVNAKYLAEVSLGYHSQALSREVFSHAFRAKILSYAAPPALSLRGTPRSSISCKIQIIVIS